MSYKGSDLISPKVGDILLDQNGNKMVVIDVNFHGDCYVLFNGKIKFVNVQSPYIVKNETLHEQLKDEVNNNGERRSSK
jgi:hypothetical protein